MSFLADVIAGCAPGTNECADQSMPTDVNAWGLLLFLIVAVPLLLAVVAGVALVVRRGLRGRSEVASRIDDPALHA